MKSRAELQTATKTATFVALVGNITCGYSLLARLGARFFARFRLPPDFSYTPLQKQNAVTTIECKINPEKFNPQNLSIFRTDYPQGENWVLSPAIKTSYCRKFGNLMVDFLPLESVIGSRTESDLRIQNH